MARSPGRVVLAFSRLGEKVVAEGDRMRVSADG
jgi:hypothetical protein